MTLLSAVPPAEESAADAYLTAQADLTAVERFAQRHEAGALPQQARYYRDLIPLAQPAPGEQFRFAVDLDACTGCKSCVTACHSLNGLDEDESWRRVVVRDDRSTVTSACHHCVEPACLAGCPVDAYEKDPITGIVAHLDDQCIGCGYCTLTCPYEVPVLNHDKGIVRKCDLCRDRLAEGEAPACVQACPNDAIRVEVVDLASVDAVGTGPTTVYLSPRRGTVEAPEVVTEHPPGHHTPLAVMLVLTQLSVGAFLVDLVARRGAASAFGAVVALAAGLVALAASVLHLGRPRYAYRAVIGFRHSWLSREVIAFGAFTGLAAPYALGLWLGHSLPLLGAAVAACGVVGVACSVMIYVVTGRPSWTVRRVATSFTRTTLLGGTATVVWAAAVAEGRLLGAGALTAVLALVVTLELRARLAFFTRHVG